MSMNAIFVQVEDREIDGFEADPDSVEELFAEGPRAAGLMNVAVLMQERIRAMGPQEMEARLSRLPEPLRQQVEASMGRSKAALDSGQDLAKLLHERLAQRVKPVTATRETLSLEKAWHGVHYLLSESVEPGPELPSQAVLGGVELGDDPEGFSGYGPARYFRAAEVRKLAEALRRPEVEAAAAVRFDASRMSQLQIYPGWRAGEQDKEWLMDAFRRLREFYAGAAARNRAVITCLV